MRKKVSAPIALIIVLTLTLGNAGVGSAGETTLRPPSLRYERAADGGFKERLGRILVQLSEALLRPVGQEKKVALPKYPAPTNAEQARRQIAGLQTFLGPFGQRLERVRSEPDVAGLRDTLALVIQMQDRLDWLKNREDAAPKELFLLEELDYRGQIYVARIELTTGRKYDAPQERIDDFETGKRLTYLSVALTNHLLKGYLAGSGEKLDDYEKEAIRARGLLVQLAERYERVVDSVHPTTDPIAFRRAQLARTIHLAWANLFSLRIPIERGAAADRNFRTTTLKPAWDTATALIEQTRKAIQERDPQDVPVPHLAGVMEGFLDVLLRGM